MRKQTTMEAFSELHGRMVDVAKAFDEVTHAVDRLKYIAEKLEKVLEDTMNSISWEAVKEFYQKEFGIDAWVVEVYANMDILHLCISGASNSDIEKFLEIPITEIVKVIREAFDFDGWEESLPINPYRLFCGYSGEISSVAHFTEFTGELAMELSKYKTLEPIRPEKVFYMCETMYDIERKIQDEWI